MPISDKSFVVRKTVARPTSGTWLRMSSTLKWPLRSSIALTTARRGGVMRCLCSSSRRTIDSRLYMVPLIETWYQYTTRSQQPCQDGSRLGDASEGDGPPVGLMLYWNEAFLLPSTLEKMEVCLWS